jgi:uncharacterized membrane protein YdfJ with MMPL/SSD domain
MAADGGISVLGYAATASGLTVFGIATGLDPAVLIAGFAGGLWAQSYHPPMSILARIGLTILASIIAGYLAPAGATVAAAGVGLFSPLKGVLSVAVLQLPIAVIIGLIAHRILGPAIMKLAAKKTESLDSTEQPRESEK